MSDPKEFGQREWAGPWRLTANYYWTRRHWSAPYGRRILCTHFGPRVSP